MGKNIIEDKSGEQEWRDALEKGRENMKHLENARKSHPSKNKTLEELEQDTMLEHFFMAE